MNLAFPYTFDGTGRSADADADEHLRDLIDQVLFTGPGERVNRPQFGSGLQQLAFAPMSDELAATTQFLVQGALQQWLGDLIAVQDVSVSPQDDGMFLISVSYLVRRTGQQQTAQFQSGGS